MKNKQRWKFVSVSTYSVRDTLLVSPGRPHGNSRTLMFPELQKVGSLWLVELWKGENGIYIYHTDTQKNTKSHKVLELKSGADFDQTAALCLE